MGKRRIIAETGAGQHGVAAATACALLELECIVYMGTEDMRRQKPNVERMGLLGARVEPVEAGARTLKEAVSAAIRDWVTNVEDTHYIIGSCVGPRPYPVLVRELQRVIGDEARAQVLEQDGAPARARDRVRRRRLERDRDLHRRSSTTRASSWSGSRPPARARFGTAPPRRPADGRRAPGVLHGAYSAIMQNEDGQILEAHSISAGLDYPGSGPEHAWLRDTGRARYWRSPTRRRSRRSRRLARLEGIIPALESAHAIAWAVGERTERARPGVPVGPRRQGPGRGRSRLPSQRAIERQRDRR